MPSSCWNKRIPLIAQGQLRSSPYRLTCEVQRERDGSTANGSVTVSDNSEHSQHLACEKTWSKMDHEVTPSVRNIHEHLLEPVFSYGFGSEISLVRKRPFDLVCSVGLPQPSYARATLTGTGDLGLSRLTTATTY